MVAFDPLESVTVGLELSGIEIDLVMLVYVVVTNGSRFPEELIIVAVTLGVYEVRLELTLPVLVPFAMILSITAINHIIEAIAMHHEQSLLSIKTSVQYYVFIIVF